MRTALTALAVAAALAAAPAASAATLTATFPAKADGMRVVVVQASGTGKAQRIASGRVSIRVANLDGATAHLVAKDGSYAGPIVLAGSGAKVYATIKGRKALALGRVALKSGYARAGGVRAARVNRTAAYAVPATRGKPRGAGRNGRVAVAGTVLGGVAGGGHDADLDGIPAVFDVDDDGDLILDNVDRSARASRRALAPAPRQPCGPPPLPPCGGGGGGAGGATDFKLFSNFKLTGAASINAYLGTTGEVNALIAELFPVTLSLATQVIADDATLDCLGSAYCAAHALAGQDFPRMNNDTATTSGTTMTLVKGPTNDAQIVPGGTADQVRGGDAFVQIADGVSYPGLLNFAFVTAPAVHSYETSTSGGPVLLAYGADGRLSSGHGMSPSDPIPVSSADPWITLTWWRPQRVALTGEASESGWIDIGGLRYTADVPNAIRRGGGVNVGTAPGHCGAASYSETVSNGSPFANPAGTEGVRDPAVDAPTDPAHPTDHLLEYRIDARECFGAGTWGSVTLGDTFDFDIQAVSEYGDNAARKLFFVVQ